MYHQLLSKIRLNGQSERTLANYGRSVAKLSLYFGCAPLELTDDQINDYLLLLRDRHNPSASYFKHTVYGLRYCFRLVGREDRAIQLPSIKRIKDLPVVLSRAECRRLFQAPQLLKHRILLCLVYSAGLRISELTRLLQADIDFDRMQIHIRRSKYNKDRYVPLSPYIAKGLKKYYHACQPQEWVIYAKRPWGGPKQVVEYLSRYPHKVAISNHRITEIGTKTVCFAYKDYRQGGKNKQMRLDKQEFIRRFAQHILPKGFVRIRYYGFLASRAKDKKLTIARKQLEDQSPLPLYSCQYTQHKPQPYDPKNSL